MSFVRAEMSQETRRLKRRTQRVEKERKDKRDADTSPRPLSAPKGTIRVLRERRGESSNLVTEVRDGVPKWETAKLPAHKRRTLTIWDFALLSSLHLEVR